MTRAFTTSILAQGVKKAKTPRQAASRLAAYIRQAYNANANSVVLWSPKETAEHGFGDGWSICWEEGPHEWAISATGGNEPFTEGLMTQTWFAEPYNGFVLNFHERDWQS